MASLFGTDQIKVPSSASLIFNFDHPDLDPLYVHSGATAIEWAYHLNTVSTPTIGGEVVQVLSATVGPMSIKGQTAGLKTNQTGALDKDEVRGWRDQGTRKAFTPNDELREIVEWFRTYMTLAGTSLPRNERAIQFTYPERGWSFWIQVTKLDGFRYDRAVIAPEWSITAEIVNDNALNYFKGITMSSFTDDLITNHELLGKIGLSSFANSKTETDNRAFGETGQSGSTNPFLNPELSISSADAAKKMGDNFQSLVAAWSSGNFATFGFGALLDNGALPNNVDAVYQELFGAPFIGSPSQTSGSTGSGSVVYNGPANPGTRDQLVLDISSSFERYSIPGKLGVAVAMHESGLNPDRTQDGCTKTSCGIGLFQTNGDGSGRDSRAMVKTAGQHRVYGSEQGNITPYYPAGEQISAAAQWYNEFATSDFPGTDFMSASNDTLAALAVSAQSPGDRAGYKQIILAALPDAEKAIRDASAGVNNNASVPTGSTVNLAKQLLSHYGEKWHDDNGKGRAQIEKVANGQLLTNQGGQQVALDPRPMQVVLALINRGYTVGTFAWCEDHSFNSGAHPKGRAVDISSINGVAINVDSQSAHDLTLEVAKVLRNMASLPLTQLICGGYGNKRAADISSQCIPAADSFYGSDTMQQHTNHIHCGF